MNEATYSYRLGLALSGGGARGIAHLGVLEAMRERSICPNIIAGTSAGALAGVLYADGYEPLEILSLFKNKAFREFAEISIPSGGFFKTDKLKIFLKKHLRAKTFEELQIPLRVVTTDIEEGCSVIFTKGELIPAIVASCSIPLVFVPVEINGSYYVDGGMFRNFPVSVIRKECESVIGVNVTPISHQKYKKSILYIAERSFLFMMLANTIGDRKLCDLLIEPPSISNHSTFGLDDIDKLYRVGYESAVQLFENETDKLVCLSSKQLN